MDYVKKLFQSEETRQQNEYEHAKKSCTNFALTRKKCWKSSVSGNKNTEECFIEELEEKRCMSECLCNDVYKNFYERSSCHLWAEAFAHKNSSKYINARDQINKNKDLKAACKKLTHQMSACMSMYMKYSNEGTEGQTFLNNRAR